MVAMLTSGSEPSAPSNSQPGQLAPLSPSIVAKAVSMYAAPSALVALRCHTPAPSVKAAPEATALFQAVTTAGWSNVGRPVVFHEPPPLLPPGAEEGVKLLSRKTTSFFGLNFGAPSVTVEYQGAPT